MTIEARFKSFRRRLHADADKGSAAVEFAVVAPVFFLILLATIESGVVFFAQSTLQNAVNDAARLVRTGQTACFSLDSGGKCAVITADQFRIRVCDQVHVLLPNCSADSNGNSDLQFDIRAYPSGFTGLGNSSPLNGTNGLPNLTAFNVGNACDVVLVRAFYKWPVFTPGLSYLLGNMAGGKHLLATAAAFRNEPYNPATGGC
ncbi:MAG TPA: TadE/TadG family type IV pilus assembly protein [Rhizomicrobium sp.]|nr:TadE/TadG family type IV pilus assembly protein [Rhizomicrobium sp.]